MAASARIAAIDRVAVLDLSLVCKDLRSQVRAEETALEQRSRSATDPTKTARLKAALEKSQAESRAEIEQALATIIERIMIEKSTNVLLDAKWVLRAPPDRDITRRVIQDLDKKMPRLAIRISRRMETVTAADHN
jgi:Skp family chaperone for outer membrane proteins